MPTGRPRRDRRRRPRTNGTPRSPAARGRKVDAGPVAAQADSPGRARRRAVAGQRGRGAQLLALLLEHPHRRSAIRWGHHRGRSVDPIRGSSSAVVSVDLRRLNEMHWLDKVSGEAELGAGLTGPDAERLLGERASPSGTFRKASASPPSAATRSPAHRGRTPPDTAASTRWSAACIWSRRSAYSTWVGPRVSGGTRPATARSRIRGHLRNCHPRPDSRAPDPGKRPLRGVVVPRFHHRGGRPARRHPDRHRPDRPETVRRNGNRRQPRQARKALVNNRSPAAAWPSPCSRAPRPHRAGMPKPAPCSKRTAERRSVRRRPRRGSTADSTPYLRDSLLASGALCRDARDGDHMVEPRDSEGRGHHRPHDVAGRKRHRLVLCHISHVTRPARRCTSPSSRDSAATPWSSGARPKSLPAGRSARTTAPSAITTPSAPTTALDDG